MTKKKSHDVPPFIPAVCITPWREVVMPGCIHRNIEEYPVEIEIAHTALPWKFIGIAKRSGCTPPGYPYICAYRFEQWNMGWLPHGWYFYFDASTNTFYDYKTWLQEYDEYRNKIA